MAQQQPVRGSTQDFVEIHDIIDDIVLMKDGSCVVVIETTAVNFGLLSETEQDAIIYAYAALLNSLSFPIQIVVRSKKMDISSYLSSLDEKIASQKNEALKNQMQLYRNWVEAMIKDNNVLDKKFYIVVPFSRLELGASGSFGATKGLPYDKNYILQKARDIVYPKRDHILRQLSRLSLNASVLTTPRLAALFYEIYNPDTTGVADITLGIKEYLSPIVEPVMGVKVEKPVEETK